MTLRLTVSGLLVFISKFSPPDIISEFGEMMVDEKMEGTGKVVLNEKKLYRKSANQIIVGL